MDIFLIALRSLIVYIVIVFGIRIFGKREISQLSVIDLVFILLISNSVQNAMVGSDTTLMGGIVAAIALFVANLLLGNLLYKSKRVNKLLQGSPLMLIYQGRVIQKHLDQAKIPHEELEAVVREHGVDTIENVNLAVLEADGNISVLSDDFKTRSVRKRHAHKVVEIGS
jgi:uncharacterized membrane protein YcaP (DUF421 family)